MIDIRYIALGLFGAVALAAVFLVLPPYYRLSGVLVAIAIPLYALTLLRWED